MSQSIDSIAKQFGFRESDAPDGVVLHARHQFVTLISQEEITTPFKMFYEDFLRAIQEQEKSGYRGPSQKRVLHFSTLHVDDTSNKKYRGYQLKTEKWAKLDWYVWFVITVVDSLRSPQNLWQGREDSAELCKLGYDLLCWLITQLQYHQDTYYETRRAYSYISRAGQLASSSKKVTKDVQPESQAEQLALSSKKVAKDSSKKVAKDTQPESQAEQLPSSSPYSIPTPDDLSDEMIMMHLRQHRAISDHAALELRESTTGATRQPTTKVSPSFPVIPWANIQ